MIHDLQKGHRKRLWKRFSLSKEVIPDYEILELLLFFVFKRKDTKPLAKALLNHFKTFRGLFYADLDDIKAINGVGNVTANFIGLIREAYSRILIEEVKRKKIINSSEAVINYYQHKFSGLKIEEFHVMFLNNKNYLIKEERLQTGTVNITPVYSREIMVKALKYGASAIIMIHNHPSGDPKPSKNDILVTNEVNAAAKTLGILLLDHLIIGNNSYHSLINIIN